MQMVQAQQDVQQYKRSFKSMSLTSSSFMGDQMSNRGQGGGLVDFRSIQQQQRESRIVPPSLHSFREDDEMGFADEGGSQFGRSLTSRNIPGMNGKGMSINQGNSLTLGTSPTVFSLLATSSDTRRGSLLGPGSSPKPSSRTVFSTMSNSLTGQTGSHLGGGKEENKADDSFNQEEDMMFALSLGPDESNSFLKEEEPPQAGMEGLYMFD